MNAADCYALLHWVDFLLCSVDLSTRALSTLFSGGCFECMVSDFGACATLVLSCLALNEMSEMIHHGVLCCWHWNACFLLARFAWRVA